MAYFNAESAASTLLDLSPILDPRAGSVSGLSVVTTAVKGCSENLCRVPQGSDPAGFGLSADPSYPGRRIRHVKSRSADAISRTIAPIPAPIVVPGKGKVFQCPYPNCNMVFTRSEHLARHSRKHTGEKPFQCVIPRCDRIFSRFDNMMQHTQTHQRDGKQSNISTIANASTRVRGRRSSSLANKGDMAPKFLCAGEDSDPNARRLSQFCIQPSDLKNSTLTLRPITSELVHAQHAEAKKARARANAQREGIGGEYYGDGAYLEVGAGSSKISSPAMTMTTVDGTDGPHPGPSPTFERSINLHDHLTVARHSTNIPVQTVPNSTNLTTQAGRGSKRRYSTILPNTSDRPTLMCLEPNPTTPNVGPNLFQNRSQPVSDSAPAHRPMPATELAPQASPTVTNFVAPPPSAHGLLSPHQPPLLPRPTLRSRASLSGSLSAIATPPQYQTAPAADCTAVGMHYTHHTAYQLYPRVSPPHDQYAQYHQHHGHQQHLTGGNEAEPYYPPYPSQPQCPLTPEGR
ncbi:Up in starvation [Tieghemiomyces parasiticus]|uniref:Up in starvation n=1 Tax=Tieghemiomyces parasiticus TaxID=78921 RepID=A0A9W8DXS3_9FUNG|nr:Up in starvation [Tieghemiomyces parasiticus]